MNQWIQNRTMNSRWCEKQLDSGRKGDTDTDTDTELANERNILTNYKLMEIGIEIGVGERKSKL